MRTKARPGGQGQGADTTKPLGGGGGNSSTPRTYRYVCLLCNRPNGSLTRREGRWLLNCWSCEPGGPYITALAQALGTDGGRLLSNPPQYLGPYLVGRAAGKRRKPAPLPSDEALDGWQRALLDSPLLLRYLRRRRGLSEESVRRWDLGWDEAHQGFTLPVYDRTGALVNVTWRALSQDFGLCGSNGRYLQTRKKVHRLAGRRAADGCLPLYPDVPPEGPLLLVEGEFDALVARQNGLPAVTGLLGQLWVGAWDEAVRGRRVAVVYDTGAEQAAAATVQKLREASASAAWLVRLGLPNRGDDVVDWFVTYRRSTRALLRLIREGGSSEP